MLMEDKGAGDSPSTTRSHNSRRWPSLLHANGNSRRLHIGLGLAVAVAAIVGIVGWNHSATPKSSLPRSITSQMDFTPYFFSSDIPLGYSAKPADIAYSRGLLSVRLTKANSPDVTISQQKLPTQLRPEDVLTAEKKLDVPFGVGTINQVEGRLLASIVTNDPQPVLILISSQSSENQAIVEALAEVLDKVR